MGFTSFIGPAMQMIGGLGGGFLGSQGSSSGKLPKWYRQSSRRLGEAGEAIASRPYEGYGGTQVAPFSQDTLNAFDMVRQNIGMGAGNYQNAMNTAQALQGYNAPSVGPATANTWLQGSGQIDQYMNPYTQQVIDASMTDLENQRQVQSQDLASQAQAAKAFGGSRFGVAQGQFEADALRNKGLLAADLRNQGFESAANRLSQDVAAQNQFGLANQQANMFNSSMDIASAGVRNQNAFLEGELANRMRAASSADTQALANSGAAQQAQAQQMADVGYRNFLEQRDWAPNQLAWWSQSLAPGSQNVPAVNYGGGVLGALGGAQLGAQAGGAVYDWMKNWNTPPPTAGGTGTTGDVWNSSQAWNQWGR